MLNVLFQIRHDYMKNIAGDSIQMIKTREYLLKLGLNIDISTDCKMNLSKYQLVHIFNILKAGEPYKFLQNAMKQKKPYVLSTIYWNPTRYTDNQSGNFPPQNWWHKQYAPRIELLSNARVLLPNSMAELQLIEKDFQIKKKYFIIPNCCDKFFYYSKADDFIQKHNLRDFVLCVGRICPRKNQLSLIKALKKTGLKLVLIGPSGNREYYKKCNDLTECGDVLFLNSVKHEDLASAYAAAKVHVLPSHFETPGLASLEAGLAGCGIVTTKMDATIEYFRNMAIYCLPYSVKSIKKAVLEAYEKPYDCERLKEHILKNYIWEIAAEKTLKAYEYALQI